MVIEVTVTGIDEAMEYIDRADSRFIPAMSRTLRNMANELAIRISGLAPYHHGTLKRGIKPHQEDELTFIVASDMPYADHQNYGTDGHIIIPVRKPYLHFFWEKVGHFVKLKQAKIPPMPGKHFVEQAIDDYEADAVERAAKDMEYMGIGEVE